MNNQTLDMKTKKSAITWNECHRMVGLIGSFILVFGIVAGAGYLVYLGKNVEAFGVVVTSVASFWALGSGKKNK